MAGLRSRVFEAGTTYARVESRAKDATGRQTYVRYEGHPEEERTARTSGRSSAVAVHG